MKGQPQVVGVLREQRRIDQRGEQPLGHPVPHQAVRVAIQDDCRVRLMAVQDELKHAADVAHLVGGQRCLRIDVRVAAGLEQPVAFAQRDLQGLGEHQQRLPAWLGAASLDEAHVARREAGLHREIELAHPPGGPPVAQQVANRAERLCGRCAWAMHGAMLRPGGSRVPLPPR